MVDDFYDFFLQTLINAVYKTYDEWHFPEKSFHKHKKRNEENINNLKRHHVGVLLEYYDKERFKNCKDLYSERVKFLNEVQNIVNTLRGI